MASRAIWKGQLRLSLVAIPVEITSAVRTGRRASFSQVHGPSGKPANYEKTVRGIGKVSGGEICSASSEGIVNKRGGSAYRRGAPAVGARADRRRPPAPCQLSGTARGQDAAR